MYSCTIAVCLYWLHFIKFITVYSEHFGSELIHPTRIPLGTYSAIPSEKLANWEAHTFNLLALPTHSNCNHRDCITIALMIVSTFAIQSLKNRKCAGKLNNLITDILGSKYLRNLHALSRRTY